MSATFTIFSLAESLRDAEGAHAEFEKALGRRDENWPEWYATYMIHKSYPPPIEKLVRTPQGFYHTVPIGVDDKPDEPQDFHLCHIYGQPENCIATLRASKIPIGVPTKFGSMCSPWPRRKGEGTEPETQSLLLPQPTTEYKPHDNIDDSFDEAPSEELEGE